MQDIAFLEYTFIFDTTKTFQHLSQFEKVILDAFTNAGVEAQLVNAVGSAPTRRIIYIAEKPMIEMPAVSPTSVPDKSVKQIKAELARKRNYSGKFTK